MADAAKFERVEFQGAGPMGRGDSRLEVLFPAVVTNGLDVVLVAVRGKDVKGCGDSFTDLD